MNTFFKKKLLFTSPQCPLATFSLHLHIGPHANAPSREVQYVLARTNGLEEKKEE